METILKVLKWIVKLYTPPPMGDAAHTFRYQLAMSVGVVGIWSVAWIVFAWLIGTVPFVPQVAWAADVQDVKLQISTVDHKSDKISLQLSAIQLLSVQTNLAEQLKNWCRAQQAKNQSDLDNANQQLYSLMSMYAGMTGHDFHLPDCKTILVGN